MEKNPQGLTINYSMVTNKDGKEEIGFRYNDTDGIKIDKHYVDENGNTGKTLTKLYTDVLKEISQQKVALKQAKEEKAKLAEKKKAQTKATQEKSAHELKIQELNQKLAKLQRENDSLKIDNAILNKRIKEHLTQTQKEKKAEVSLPESLAAAIDEYATNWDDLFDNLFL